MGVVSDLAQHLFRSHALRRGDDVLDGQDQLTSTALGNVLAAAGVLASTRQLPPQRFLVSGLAIRIDRTITNLHLNQRLEFEDCTFEPDSGEAAEQAPTLFRHGVFQALSFMNCRAFSQDLTFHDIVVRQSLHFDTVSLDARLQLDDVQIGEDLWLERVTCHVEPPLPMDLEAWAMPRRDIDFGIEVSHLRVEGDIILQHTAPRSNETPSAPTPEQTPLLFGLKLENAVVRGNLRIDGVLFTRKVALQALRVLGDVQIRNCKIGEAHSDDRLFAGNDITLGGQLQLETNIVFGSSWLARLHIGSDAVFQGNRFYGGAIAALEMHNLQVLGRMRLAEENHGGPLIFSNIDVHGDFDLERHHAGHAVRWDPLIAEFHTVNDTLTRSIPDPKLPVALLETPKTTTGFASPLVSILFHDIEIGGAFGMKLAGFKAAFPEAFEPDSTSVVFVGVRIGLDCLIELPDADKMMGKDQLRLLMWRVFIDRNLRIEGTDEAQTSFHGVSLRIGMDCILTSPNLQVFSVPYVLVSGECLLRAPTSLNPQDPLSPSMWLHLPNSQLGSLRFEPDAGAGPIILRGQERTEDAKLANGKQAFAQNSGLDLHEAEIGASLILNADKVRFDRAMLQDASIQGRVRLQLAAIAAPKRDADEPVSDMATKSGFLARRLTAQTLEFANGPQVEDYADIRRIDVRDMRVVALEDVGLFPYASSRQQQYLCAGLQFEELRGECPDAHALIALLSARHFNPAIEATAASQTENLLIIERYVSAMRKRGDIRKADRLYVEGRRRFGRATASWLEKVTETALSVTGGFGFVPWRTIGWFLGVAITFGTIWSVAVDLSCANRACYHSAPVMQTGEHGHRRDVREGKQPVGFNGFHYAFDLMLPFIDLDADERWDINLSFQPDQQTVPNALIELKKELLSIFGLGLPNQRATIDAKAEASVTWFGAFFAILKLLNSLAGIVLIAIAVSGFTGLLRRGDRV
jgi:hypothetical protein